MKSFILSVLNIGLVCMALAQQNYIAVKDATAFKNAFSLASTQIQSIESDFVQVKQLSMLKDKMTSKGKFYYKKENKVRIEYVTPYKYIMVINQQSMMVSDEHKTSNYNTRSNKIMQSINNIMLDCMRGTVYQNKDFGTQVFENAKEYLLQLTPTSSVMKKMFAHIEVYLDKKDYQVIRLQFIENGGDKSTMTFQNSHLNKSIPDALFITK